MNKKILFLVHLPPPYNGVSMINRYILQGIIHKDFCIDSISINTSKDIKDVEKKSAGKIFIFGNIFLNLLAKLLQNRYGLCYFSITPTGIGFYKDALLVFLIKLFRVEIVYHFHGQGISGRKSRVEHILYKFCFKNSKAIIISQSLFYDIKEYIAENDIYVLPNGVQMVLGNDEFERLNHGKMNKQCRNLLFLSNMIRSKGALDALEAAKILRNRGCDFKFYFVGEWRDITPEEFTNKIKEFNLDNSVECLGFKNGEEKYKILRAADILIYPTLRDTFPLVLLEAMQFGLPVVSTSEGAIPEIVVDGITGYLVNKGDCAVLAEKIEVLLNNLNLRIKMSKAAREKFLKEYTFDRFESRLIGIFYNIITV